MIPAITRLYELLVRVAATEASEFLAEHEVTLSDQACHELVATLAPTLHTAGLLHAFLSYTEGIYDVEEDADADAE